MTKILLWVGEELDPWVMGEEGWFPLGLLTDRGTMVHLEGWPNFSDTLMRVTEIPISGQSLIP